MDGKENNKDHCTSVSLGNHEELPQERRSQRKDIRESQGRYANGEDREPNMPLQVGSWNEDEEQTKRKSNDYSKKQGDRGSLDEEGADVWLSDACPVHECILA